jgi:hypothetical protein
VRGAAHGQALLSSTLCGRQDACKVGLPPCVIHRQSRVATLRLRGHVQLKCVAALHQWYSQPRSGTWGNCGTAVLKTMAARIPASSCNTQALCCCSAHPPARLLLHAHPPAHLLLREHHYQHACCCAQQLLRTLASLCICFSTSMCHTLRSTQTACGVTARVLPITLQGSCSPAPVMWAALLLVSLLLSPSTTLVMGTAQVIDRHPYYAACPVRSLSGAKGYL